MKKLALTLGLSVGLLFGCGQETVQENVEIYNAEVIVSMTNGEFILMAKDVEFESGDTVMDIMQDNFDITTAYEGTFIVGIDEYIHEDGSEYAWFYFVNDEQAMVGASDYEVEDGDVIEFDSHMWK